MEMSGGAPESLFLQAAEHSEDKAHYAAVKRTPYMSLRRQMVVLIVQGAETDGVQFAPSSCQENK